MEGISIDEMNEERICMLNILVKSRIFTTFFFFDKKINFFIKRLHHSRIMILY